MAKHDENKDVRLISRIAKVNPIDKTIRMSKGQSVGIRTLGRLDFLTHYCGYVIVYDGTVSVKSNVVKDESNSDKTYKKQVKQNIKDNSLKNKKK